MGWPILPYELERQTYAGQRSRRVQQAHLVARHWSDRGPFHVELDRPACFRCGRSADDWRDLERAHLVDRFLGGLDHSGNIVMLCDTCHARQPIFEIDQAPQALAWAMRSTVTAAQLVIAESIRRWMRGWAT